jgi:hypothetical protein
MRRIRFAALILLLALVPTCRAPQVLLRPGCRFRVVDDNTGMPVPDVKITVATVHALRDTVGRWEFTTDELGMAAMSTVRVPRNHEAVVGRNPRQYNYVAALQASGYQYYSLRISGRAIVVRLTRGYPVA